MPAALVQGNAEIGQRLRIIRLPLDGGQEAFLGLIHPAQQPVGFAEIAVKQRVAVVALDGGLDTLARVLGTAFLQRDHAEQVKRVRVFRLNRQDLPVNSLGGIEIAGTVGL